MNRIRCFEPNINEHVRVLILGSLPGEASLALGRYYGHPQNRFWSLMSDIVGTPMVDLSYSDQLQTLLNHGIGLWDVIAEAHRIGSLDSKIRDIEGNRLTHLVGRLPHLAAIAFNGKTAAKIGMRELKDHTKQYEILTLPSSSPAYAIPFEKKLNAWRILNEWTIKQT